MDWEEIKTYTEYKTAVARTMEIFHAVEGSPESDELTLLLVLIKGYEDKHIVIPTITG
jgi:HTH-type transcriptional regulator/antitoxin HigA